jgi:acetylornithine deacetylase/succinyl-diaminopimelate desuccinylase-like protein
MKDESGRVLVEGFHDSVVAPGPAEQAAIDALPDTDAALRHEYGLAATEGGERSLAEAVLWPSLNVRGMTAATVGDQARNVIPPSATASLDIRLAAGNDPVEMLALVEKHIAARGYHVVRSEPDRETRLKHPRIARVVRHPGYPAVRTAVDEPAAQVVVEAAQRVAGDELILMPTLGGSLPLYLFADKLDRPLVVVPIANHDNNQHGPDENLRVGNLWYGIELFAAVIAAP